MSLFKVFDIAGSAMGAQSIRLNLVASNLANAQSASSSVGGTYRARYPVFAAEAQGADSTAGVRVLGVVEGAAPARQEFQPEHPLADEKGYVHFPNVNAVEEMANMISASRSYQTNAEVISAGKQMMLRTLALGQ